MNLKDHFPRASKAFLDANNHQTVPTVAEAQENSLQVKQGGKKRRSMTTPEREMASQLEMMRRNNEIESWKFEGVTLKLADGCRYTPDFFVVLGRRVRFIETKGPFIREDSMIKFKVAREQNPWAEWQLHQRTKNGWTQLI